MNNINKRRKRRLRKKVYARWQSHLEYGRYIFRLSGLCCKCGCQILFFEPYDAEFCPQCNKWERPKCSKPDCEYCSDRPQTPNKGLEIYEARHGDSGAVRAEYNWHKILHKRRLREIRRNSANLADYDEWEIKEAMKKRRNSVNVKLRTRNKNT